MPHNTKEQDVGTARKKAKGRVTHCQILNGTATFWREFFNDDWRNFPPVVRRYNSLPEHHIANFRRVPTFGVASGSTTGSRRGSLSLWGVQVFEEFPLGRACSATGPKVGSCAPSLSSSHLLRRWRMPGGHGARRPCRECVHAADAVSVYTV